MKISNTWWQELMDKSNATYKNSKWLHTQEVFLTDEGVSKKKMHIPLNFDLSNSEDVSAGIACLDITQIFSFNQSDYDGVTTLRFYNGHSCMIIMSFDDVLYRLQQYEKEMIKIKVVSTLN